MTKRPASLIEIAKFANTIRALDGNVEVTKVLLCESPAAACATRSKQLRALVTFMSGQGFEVFNGLADELKCNLVWLLEDLAGEVADLADLSLEAEIVRRTAAEVPHD